MAYNREWDKGKETWDEQSAWEIAESRHGVRNREDDYYGDTKRRKVNTGGYQGHDAYGDSTYSSASYTLDQAQDSGAQQRGTAGAFPKKRLVPSEPSPHVIFLGLDPDFTESDLQAYLSSHRCSIETVTIIRERSSGASRGFGFAQFSSTEHARAFVDPIFPFIQVPPPASHGASASAAFYKALESGTPHNGRRVKIDYSQSASPHEKGRSNRSNVNDGTRDIGNSPGPVLLFRGLDELSGPQAILQAMKSVFGSGKEAKGMRRIILIKDRVTLASFCFSFVEFVNIESASTVLGATMSSQIHPAGFRISDRPVAASFANPDSFQPIADVMLRDEACLTSSLSLGGVEGSWVRYWDDASTIAALEFQVETPQTSSLSAKEKKEKKKKAEGARPASQVTASALPVSDKPLTLNLSKGFSKPGATGSIKPLVLGFSEDLQEDDLELSTDADKTSKRGIALIANKKTAGNISKWNQIQEELSNTDQNEASSQTSTQRDGYKHSLVSVSSEQDTTEEIFEFADINSMSCLLCARQFKSPEQLQRHNRESGLHKKNLQDAKLRDAARQKVNIRRKALSDALPEPGRYRDRASERRVFFNQPEIPLLDTDNAKQNKRRHLVEEQPPSPPRSSVHLGKDETNIGNKLLKMMGWTEGAGLGAMGDGRVDPIQATVYSEGVGLGASKGKEIERFAEGFSSYSSMVQDSARERYSTA